MMRRFLRRRRYRSIDIQGQHWRQERSLARLVGEKGQFSLSNPA